MKRKSQSNSSINEDNILSMNDLVIEKVIGAGGSAKVYKATYKQIDVAVKRLDLSSIGSDKAKLEFKREVITLSRIRHPNLVLFMGVTQDKDNLCIVTEFCFGGTLFELLHGDHKIPLSWKQKLGI